MTEQVIPAPETAHICQPFFNGCGDMRGAYDRLGVLPTSTVADIFLIRSHIAYWAGNKCAEEAVIKPSRGHSYRVLNGGARYPKIVRIDDEYDHRLGVKGWC